MKITTSEGISFDNHREEFDLIDHAMKTKNQLENEFPDAFIEYDWPLLKIWRRKLTGWERFQRGLSFKRYCALSEDITWNFHSPDIGIIMNRCNSKTILIAHRLAIMIGVKEIHNDDHSYISKAEK